MLISKFKQEALVWFASKHNLEIKHLTSTLDEKSQEEVDGKFAELIVRACDQWVAVNYDEKAPVVQSGDLLRHFGVETQPTPIKHEASQACANPVEEELKFIIRVLRNFMPSQEGLAELAMSNALPPKMFDALAAIDLLEASLDNRVHAKKLITRGVNTKK